MKLKLHSPVEGHQPGDVITVDKAKGEWLVTNGYAVEEGVEVDDEFGVRQTDVTPDKLPTLAENREKPDEPTPGVDDSTNDQPVDQAGEVVEEEKAEAPKTRRKSS